MKLYYAQANAQETYPDIKPAASDYDFRPPVSQMPLQRTDLELGRWIEEIEDCVVGSMKNYSQIDELEPYTSKFVQVINLYTVCSLFECIDWK